MAITITISWKSFENFNMTQEKPIITPLASHFKLTTNQCPSSIEAKEEMSNIAYASVVGMLE